MRTDLSCKVSIASLITVPYSIEWGSLIYAQVQAINIKGRSPMSSVGTGAKILTNPDAPLNLVNDPTITLATQIGIKWEIGVNNGGAPVLDYRVTFLDPAAGVFEILQSGIAVTSFVATGLTAGVTYTFEVQSRNVYGFSAYSNQV